MVCERIVIVNADDFGQSAGVNRGIIEAHEHGIVTSTSLMVRGSAAVSAAEYARANGQLGVGLHLDLGEWTKQGEEWQARYEVVPADDPAAIRAEWFRQLDQFRTLMGRDPTHLDSHQHVHRQGAAQCVAEELARELAVPLRHFCSHIRYCGDFYGQPWQGQSMADHVRVPALLRIFRSLPSGITELACHPAYTEGLQSDYFEERVLEVATLCHPDVKAMIASENIQLRSFDSPDVVEVLRT